MELAILIDTKSRELRDSIAVIMSRLNESAAIVSSANQVQAQIAMGQMPPTQGEQPLTSGLEAAADLLADTVERMRALVQTLRSRAKITVVNGMPHDA